jgi:hypothetical protein
MFIRLFFVFILSISFVQAQQVLFPTKGIQPAICVGENESVEMVFGKRNEFYYTASGDKGKTFSSPVLVDSLQGLHLGVSRGPQIASGLNSTVITAIDKQGNLYAFVLDYKTKKWGKRLKINDVPEIAKEGFNALASDGKNTFFVIWLDLREDKQNKIYGAVSKDGGVTWSKNKLIYRSPDSTVCECCQPSILMKDNRVFVMFRNWIDGSRDMYVTTSNDGGNTFQPAEKMGLGTWKLKACPMDGGGISVTKSGVLTTVFRRENQLFTAKRGEPEQLLAPGRNASIAASDQATFITWQDQGQIWLSQSGKGQPVSLGMGRYPKVALLNDGEAICVWEEKESIKGMILNVNKK